MCSAKRKINFAVLIAYNQVFKETIAGEL